VATVGHDGVVAAMHVLDCGRGVVAISRLGTSGACVVVVETEAMGPTIVHVKPIISDNSHQRHWCKWHRDKRGHRWGGSKDCWFGNFADGCIGAMKTRLAGG